MNKDIELIENALVEYDRVAAGLAELRSRYAGVVYAVDTTAGMEEARKARQEIRQPRYEVERIRKAAKAPILALGKKLDADAARITAEIEKLEAPIDQQIKAEEARKEAERQAKIEAEARRLKHIQERIAELRGNTMLTPSSGAGLIAEHITSLENMPVDDSFDEFREQAVDAKAAGLARLRNLHEAAVAHEAEQRRIEAERQELARLRAEQEARDKAERERIAAEERAAKQAREAAEREAAEKLRQQREALAAQEREQQARLRAEQEKLTRERAEIERAKAEALAAQRKHSSPDPGVEGGPGGAAIAASSGTAVARPSDEEIIRAVAERFGVSARTAAGWIAEVNLEVLERTGPT